MTDDIEKTLKDFLRSPEASSGIHLSADEIQVMLDRLVSYRKRLHERQHKHDNELGDLRSQLADLKRTIAWARERLDPEHASTGYSCMSQVETALLIEAIEKKRGRVVAQRLLWGKKPSEEVLNETLGVLRAAVEEARREEKLWRSYLANNAHLLSWRSKNEWIDWDGAAYELGAALGLFDRRKQSFTETKHIFWTSNPVGNALHECLNQLVKAGIMERREEPDIQYRWNPEFKGTWE